MRDASSDIRTDGETPAEAGSELADPDTMSTNEQQQDDPRPVAQAINGFAEMSVEHTAGCNYSVFSWRNGNNTAHRVNTAHMTCTCEDMKWNSNGAHDVCDHVAYAVYHAPKEREVGVQAFRDLVAMVSDMNDYKRALEQRRNQMDTAASAPESSETSETAQQDADGSQGTDPAVDPEEAAAKLADAYDAVVDDMEVDVGDGGAIWPKTGFDTPEEIETSGPGGPLNVWETFIKEPDRLEYVPDDHPAAADRPSEYHKNRIEPQDVDEYISEVLE